MYCFVPKLLDLRLPDYSNVASALAFAASLLVQH